jgi:dethiobiotin synthetase
LLSRTATSRPPGGSAITILIVSGTGTGVGKTVVTAAVAALARARGESVAVVKPAQTGLPAGAPGDLADVSRLAGITDTHELARFPDPLSPEAAARVADQRPLDLAAAAAAIRALAASRQQVIVEGAGGLLVRYDPAGGTIADLALALRAPVMVVTAAGLGTLNHTALTLEALTARRVALAGLVIGSWPENPGLADRTNLTDLGGLARVCGVLAAGAGTRGQDEFLRLARASLSGPLGGCFDLAAFRQANAWQKELA